MSNEILKAPSVDDRFLSKWMEGVTKKINKVAGVGVSSGWAMTNVVSDKVLDADSTSTAELADVLGTLITDLIAAGILKE